jgi:hypothetical protein
MNPLRPRDMTARKRLAEARNLLVPRMQRRSEARRENITSHKIRWEAFAR